MCVDLLDREYYDPIDLTTWGKIEIADQTNEQLTAEACNQISSLMNQLIEYASKMEMKIEIHSRQQSNTHPHHTNTLGDNKICEYVGFFFYFLI